MWPYSFSNPSMCYNNTLWQPADDITHQCCNSEKTVIKSPSARTHKSESDSFHEVSCWSWRAHCVSVCSRSLFSSSENVVLHVTREPRWDVFQLHYSTKPRWEREVHHTCGLVAYVLVSTAWGCRRVRFRGGKKERVPDVEMRLGDQNVNEKLQYVRRKMFQKDWEVKLAWHRTTYSEIEVNLLTFSSRELKTQCKRFNQ